MLRLFVDVDGTLVRWLSATKLPEGMWLAEAWEPNTAVIQYVRRWAHDHPDGQVIVWSGGGVDYAATWGHRLLRDVPHTAAAKDIPRHRAGDVFIDDAPFDAWARWAIHPSFLPVAGQ